MEKKGEKFKLKTPIGLGGEMKNDPLIEYFTAHKKQRSMSVLHLDLTMTQSEDAIAKHEMRKYFNSLRGKTPFDDWELACVLHIYFKVYDSLFLGYIGRETMVKLLVPTLLGGQKHENVETAIDMADLLMRKFDFDRDGRITFDEFANEIRKNPEQIELCGQVFPDRMKIYAFMATFTRNVAINPQDYIRSLVKE